MTSLVVGIIAAVCTALSFFGIPYVGFVGLVMGIVAWVMGSKASRLDAQDTKAKAGLLILPKAKRKFLTSQEETASL